MAKNIMIKELLYKPFSVPPLHDKLIIVSKSSTYLSITIFNPYPAKVENMVSSK